MSLINQVLNDLEKRGANQPLGEDEIRAVPKQKPKVFWIYVAVGLLAIIAVLWWALTQPHALPEPVVVSSARPVTPPVVVSTGVLASAVEVVSQPQVESQVAEASSVGATDFPFASRLSFELSSIPLPNSLRGKPLVDLALPEVEPPPRKIGKPDVPADAEATPGVSIQLKKVSPQQQAENEFRKANLLANQGLLKEAMTGYEKALHIEPLHVAAREALVAVLLENKQNSDAERVLQEGLKQDQAQTQFAMMLARLQVERNALNLALDTLQQTLPYADRRADYHAFVAAIMQRLNRHKEAITHYQLALQITPNSGVWLMGLGISLQAVERKEDARDAYKRALETHNLNAGLQAFVLQRLKEIKS